MSGGFIRNMYSITPNPRNRGKQKDGLPIGDIAAGAVGWTLLPS